MYRRFLNNSDYLGIITQEALQQLTRGNDERFIQAEQSAEMSIVEYLSENYEVEKDRVFFPYPSANRRYRESICDLFRALPVNPAYASAHADRTPR